MSQRNDNIPGSRLVSVESPYNSIWPWYQVRNIQYAILANTHAASLGDATWTPHLCNTQYVCFGKNGFVSDTLSSFLMASGLLGSQGKYYLGRDETLRITNLVRQRKLEAVVCYTDYGISHGMQTAIDAATEAGVPVEHRTLPPDLKKHILGESLPTVAVPVAKASVYGFAAYGLLKFLRRGR